MATLLALLLSKTTLATLTHGVIHPSHPPRRGRRCRHVKGA